MENKKFEEVPVLNLKLTTKEVKSGIIHVPWIVIDTPYMIVSDKYGSKRVWIKSKKKIILYYLYKFTKVKWFIKKYNE
jgi:hypothetical protein